MKPELIEALRRLCMGRMDSAQTIADILMPDELTVAEVTQKTTAELIEHFDTSTISIDVPENAAPQATEGNSA